MSTSSTSNAASWVFRAQQHPQVANRRHPLVPIVTKGRSNSAPPVMKSTPPPGKRPPSIDEELAQLLADLREETTKKAQNRQLPQTSTATTTRSAIDDQLDHEIDTLFAAQLADTIAQDDAARMLDQLKSLMDMFRHAGHATRRSALMQVIPLLQRISDPGRALRIAVALIDEFVAAHESSDKEKTNVDAEPLICALHQATAAYPLGTQCQILVYELWGAKKLGSFAMARMSIDLWSTDLCAIDHDATTRRIEQAVDYIATMPLKYRLMAATALYRCVPDDTGLKLRALQAIAQNNLALPDTIEAQDFSKIVNQQIFTLRLDAE